MSQPAGEPVSEGHLQTRKGGILLVYVSNFDEFSHTVKHNRITEVLTANIREKLGIGVSPGEVQSWQNSLTFMRNALEVSRLPLHAGIAVEFQIPLTSKRIDVLVSGKDEASSPQVVIVELKQWSSVEQTDKPGVVKTHLGGSLVETTHPSYQAWSYASFIADYNEAVQTKQIQLNPCSYLHNCDDAKTLRSPQYESDITQAPLFLKHEVDELGEFIARFVRHGDNADSLYEIDQSRIRPSRQLIEHLTSLVKGNEEFILLDEQKVAAETILALEKRSREGERQVLIIEGGPGTGKSVLAINMLGKLTSEERVAQYVTRNTAPRQVFEAKLTKTFKKSRISNLFKSAGSYINVSPKSIDAVLVDEAHRLSPKSGPMGNLGENQVKEIIEASKLSVFFLDEHQQVLLKDIGTDAEIARWATHFDAEVSRVKLPSQFRCNGSDGYLDWVDEVLQVREVTNKTNGSLNYEINVFDSPNELFNQIEARAAEHFSARVVAGYCWKWVSRKQADAFDIEMPEFKFKKRWNLASHGSYWIVEPESIAEIGCIHTCQGLELDYVGVIIGKDLLVRDDRIVTDATQRAPDDKTIRGYKTQLKLDPASTSKLLDRIVKNTYRTLMTRGMKGCYLFCVDEETNDYFKRKLP